MNIRGKEFCGFKATQIRDVLKAFDRLPSRHHFKGGKLIRVPKLLTASLVAKQLKIGRKRAAEVIGCLRKGGLLEARANIPTPQAAALKEASALLQLNRSTAEKIAARLIAEAKTQNKRAVPHAKILRLEFFGSYVGRAPKVSDIDVQVIFPPPGLDFTLEDQEAQEIVGKALKTVSRYVSLHWQFDAIAAVARPRRIIRFRRRA